MRQAVIYQQAGDIGRCTDLIRPALELTQGPRAGGDRLSGSTADAGGAAGSAAAADLSFREPINRTGPVEFLDECLRQDPNHLQALWCQAAVRSLRGDQEGLSPGRGHGAAATWPTPASSI